MIIELKKFGNVLLSRPAGRDAFLSAKAYLLPNTADESFIIDFSGVDVLSPSWADEFISGLRELYGNKNITFKNTSNPSVEETLKIVNNEQGAKK